MAHSQARYRLPGSSVGEAYTIDREILKGKISIETNHFTLILQNRNVNSLHLSEAVMNFQRQASSVVRKACCNLSA